MHAFPADKLVGSVLDERNDAIDFTTGEPVHTHGGAAIDLGATGCPVVYKYAYLMDQQSPRFGRQTMTNPLAWTMWTDLASLDPSATAYRVRDSAGAVLLDWTPIAANANEEYAIELHRNTVPALGTVTGQMHLEVRFRTTSGAETVYSACWEHHPLAAPLVVEPLAVGDMYAWTLPIGAPFSELLDMSGPLTDSNPWGAPAYSQHIVQYSAEPITFTMKITAPTGAVSQTKSDTYIKTRLDTTPYACPNYIQGACAPWTPPAPIHTTVNGTFNANVLWMSRVIDETSGAIVCQNTYTFTSYSLDLVACALPPRTSTEAPHSYRLLISVGSVSTLWAAIAADDDHEYDVGAYHITALQPPVDAASGCTFANNSGIGTPFFCFKTQHFAHVIAVSKLHVDLGAAGVQFTDGPGGTSALIAPPNLAPSLFAIGATSWDAGDNGL